MGRWGFSDALTFAVVMAVWDMRREKEKRLIKTQKFYQECYEKIASDSEQAFNIVSKVVTKASRRYIPNEIASGSTYLALYVFALVIERQGRVTKEQSKIIRIYFNNIFSILIQIENYLDEKYNFLGKDSIAKEYMLHIIEQLADKCDEED
ncbi:hypothetical protein [Peptostreptococcus anaerobius]|uniref:hypothetical protein n=1 Tax=Peptostreptococcus anaerobius TaxID=1261 RepID=UPI0029052701|nr:hypothetical protein [Peptostreptococcus anaerobius]MDU1591691.1 hypothetical protein [Streptococcus anginosus]MDU1683102.1 hypothetical protein [Peptostreptococcus anaerobius]